MNTQDHSSTTYLAYMLRLWQAGTHHGRPVWRASLENPHTGERLAFRDLKALFAFLADLMASFSELKDPLDSIEPIDIGSNEHLT